MRIILANPRGFCAGVNMAIDTVDEALKIVGTPLYVYHEIVHNRHVVERFKSEGVVFVDTIDEVPDGATVVFSAHGVSPEVRNAAKQRGCTMIDATCPLVTKVHMEAIRYAKQGFKMLLVGHAGHDEVVGTVGEAPDAFTIVESAEDVEKTDFTEDDKLVYLTQTTLSMDDANVIINAIKKEVPPRQGAAERGHLLRHDQPPARRPPPRARGGPHHRRRLEELLQLRPPDRDLRQLRHAGAPRG